MPTRLHAFGDDALGDDDAVGLAARVAAGEVGADELTAAAVARAARVTDLGAVAFAAYDHPRVIDGGGGALAGVPTFVKDNTDVAGMPTNRGSEAYAAAAATSDGPYTRQFLGTGMTVLGKSRAPEFGLNASTEFRTLPATRNPWHVDHSVGASSGGSAALVASGVVPIAHGNDGGGSIRIPASCAGLVGLKPTRGRHVDGPLARVLPINIISEGVLSRSVRDTAAFLAAAEDRHRSPDLPPIGLVRGPADRRLRIGLMLDSVTGAAPDAEVRDAVEGAARILEAAGHVVEPIAPPVGPSFAGDFVQYWSVLAALAVAAGPVLMDRRFDRRRLDGLTTGLNDRHRRSVHRTPGALLRLRGSARAYARMFRRHELVLAPVLAHAPPPIGYLSPDVPFEVLIERLMRYVAYTPLNNVAGTPAMSVPAGLTRAGLPVGVQLMAARGDERTLLETAFLLELARPFPSIQASIGG